MYLLGGSLEIVGILYTGKIGLKVVRARRPRDRPLVSELRQVWVALVLVLSGVVVGVAGKVASLYVK